MGDIFINLLSLIAIPLVLFSIGAAEVSSAGLITQFVVPTGLGLDPA